MTGKRPAKIVKWPFVSERELSQLATRGWRWLAKIITRRVFADALWLGTSRAPGKIALVAGAGGVTVEAAMKTLSAKARIRGFTLIELLVVIAIIAILAAMLLPTFHTGGGSPRIGCMNKLRQIDIAFLMFSQDNGGKFPMQIPAQDGGTAEFIYTDHTFPHFEKVRKYLGGPMPLKVLVCPKDQSRQVATNYEAFCDLNISYFLNTDASLTLSNPTAVIFAGERNLAVNRQPVKAGLLTVTTNLDLNWTGEFHLNGGNLAFADGHVEWSKTNELNSWVQRQPLAANRFSIP